MTGSAEELLHRLGAVGGALGALVWAGYSVARWRHERRTRRRVAELLAAECERSRRWRPGCPEGLRPWLVPLGAVLACYVLIGGATGCLVGIGAGYGVRRWRERRVPAGEEQEAARQLPLAADLLAACVSSGAGPGQAAEAVGRSLDGPVGAALLRTAAELRLGGEPAEVWRRFGAIPGAEGLARCLERAGSSGAPAAEAVSRLAAGLREARAREAETRAQRAQVLITAPVGLCFLPAFLALGVAPVVIGLATGLLRR
ncbi:type II secretion system F family protein [Streptomyces sp. NPDC048629]|uniref:type II secretion system F family protein n=1 Tax=Streptomyces sp. NPDC048629 TaxID=3154824 RepID=UPI00341660F1